MCRSIDKAVEDLNANPDNLDLFLQQQHFRLAYWRTADQQLGYRRFFDVNTLIGLRVEREYVFEETHALITRWLREGCAGWRADRSSRWAARSAAILPTIAEVLTGGLDYR